MTKINILGFLKNIQSNISVRKLGFLVLVLIVYGNIVATVYLLQKKSVVVTQAPAAVPVKEKELTQKELSQAEAEKAKQHDLNNLLHLLPADEAYHFYYTSILVNLVNEEYVKDHTFMDTQGLLLSFPQENIYSITIPHTLLASDPDIALDLLNGRQQQSMQASISYTLRSSDGFYIQIGARHEYDAKKVKANLMEASCDGADVATKRVVSALDDLLQLKTKIENPCQYVEQRVVQSVVGFPTGIPSLGSDAEPVNSEVYAYHFDWNALERDYPDLVNLRMYSRSDYIVLRKKSDEVNSPLAFIHITIPSTNRHDVVPLTSKQVEFMDVLVSDLFSSTVVVEGCGYDSCY